MLRVVDTNRGIVVIEYEKREMGGDAGYGNPRMRRSEPVGDVVVAAADGRSVQHALNGSVLSVRTSQIRYGRF